MDKNFSLYPVTFCFFFPLVCGGICRLLLFCYPTFSPIYVILITRSFVCSSRRVSIVVLCSEIIAKNKPLLVHLVFCLEHSEFKGAAGCSEVELDSANQVVCIVKCFYF